jgi:hypothetical protein
MMLSRRRSGEVQAGIHPKIKLSGKGGPGCLDVPIPQILEGGHIDGMLVAPE